MSAKKLSLEIVKARIFEQHGDQVIIDENTYVNTNTKARFIDIEYGEFWTSPSSVASGSGHKVRSTKSANAKQTTPIDVIKERLKQAHGVIVTIDESTYTKLGSKARFLDVNYGEWWTTPCIVLGGTGHPVRGAKSAGVVQTTSIDVVKERLKQVHGDHLSIDESTYINLGYKARFIDVHYGEWWTKPSVVLSGSGHPVRGMKKIAAFRHGLPVVLHWKTNEECYSDSRWEYAVLMWLNKHKYDYNWQISFETPFETPSRKLTSIYNVDLFIKSGPYCDFYVEIKGTWKLKHNKKVEPVSSKLKWDWFHSTYQNSVLWMRPELEALGILVKGEPNPELLPKSSDVHEVSQ